MGPELRLSYHRRSTFDRRAGPPSPHTLTDVTTTSARLHGLDVLRAGALLLGIVLHALMPFLPSGGWLVMDAQRSPAGEVAVGVIHLFRMVLFMLLAGYFGRMVVHRRGARAWARDRGRRILAPLVVFGPLALASLWGVAELDHAVRGTPVPDIPLWLLFLSAPAHLWFLNVLVQCIVVTLVLRALVPALGRLAAPVGRVLATPVVGVALAAIPYLLTLLMQGSSGGVEQPTTVFPEPVPLVAFLGAFAVGWCLQAVPDALDRVARYWPVNLVAAVALTVVDGPEPVVALAAWAWTLGLVGASVRFLRREHPVVTYLADASYWMYLLHLPLLLVVEIFLADLPWTIATKLLITWLVTGAVLLVSYDLGVRDTALGGWLNGRRSPSVLGARGAREYLWWLYRPQVLTRRSHLPDDPCARTAPGGSPERASTPRPGRSTGR